MFRVAVVLIKAVLGRPEQLENCADMYDTLEVLRNIPCEYTHEDYLITEVGYIYL